MLFRSSGGGGGGDNRSFCGPGQIPDPYTGECVQIDVTDPLWLEWLRTTGGTGGYGGGPGTGGSENDQGMALWEKLLRGGSALYKGITTLGGTTSVLPDWAQSLVASYIGGTLGTLPAVLLGQLAPAVIEEIERRRKEEADKKANKMTDTGGGPDVTDPRDLYNYDPYRGSGGYDYGCPDPSMTILLAGGGVVTAGDLKVGDVVRTKHEKTLEWGNFEVTHKEIVDQPKAEVILDGGDKKVIVSTSHKFWVDNEKNWVYTTELTHGDVLSGHVLTDVKHLGNGPVVKITVKDAHTYVMEGLWSHNIKIAYPAGPKGPSGSVGIEPCVGEGCAEIINNATGGVINSGLRSLAGGGMTQYAAAGKLLHGPGDGMSDDIYANIGGRQEARLADGEFVVPADVVSHLGNGSTNAGARRLYKMMADIRSARTGNRKQAPAIEANRYLPG